MSGDPWSEMDEWCQRKCTNISRHLDEYVLKGGSLNFPQYRQKLGQHQAFMRMRSFIHGARNTPTPIA